MMPPQADYPFTYYLMVLIVFWYICLLWLYFHFILSMHFQFLVSARQCESHRVNPTEILFLWKEFITGQKARYIKQELHYSCISNNISENALLHIDLLGLKAYTQYVRFICLVLMAKYSLFLVLSSKDDFFLTSFSRSGGTSLNPPCTDYTQCLCEHFQKPHSILLSSSLKNHTEKRHLGRTLTHSLH